VWVGKGGFYNCQACRKHFLNPAQRRRGSFGRVRLDAGDHLSLCLKACTHLLKDARHRRFVHPGGDLERGLSLFLQTIHHRLGHCHALRTKCGDFLRAAIRKIEQQIYLRRGIAGKIHAHIFGEKFDGVQGIVG
jgi:hypothetical protein